MLNTGMAVVPATLRSGTLASQGVLAFALRDGKLLEARWFPDEVALEDARFGGTPAVQGPGPALKTIEAFEAAALSKTLRQAPDNDTLLSLYALMMDMVGRAKYDAGLPGVACRASRPCAITWRWSTSSRRRKRNPPEAGWAASRVSCR
ncbi:acyl-CoA-binding protein [Cupriavidus sp. amp6]|uniref:acyl-CoA-binding protein n=1 Tax=Cupriavidus sp. amp6 TaxID=388051 RepID=UPI00041C165F|nr:acyl-CoA-binding protein [Cupriavidus sp. amp6]